MDARHWTDDDFLNGLYAGTESNADPHLGGCSECRARFESWQARRAQVIAEPGISLHFLAAQRRAIYRRIGERTGMRRWVPAFAATSALLIGFVLYNPAWHSPEPASITGDDAVFAEVYSLEQRSEPLAAQPIQALFEEN